MPTGVFSDVEENSMSKPPPKAPRSLTLATLSVSALLGCAPSGGAGESIELTTSALLGNDDPANAVTAAAGFSSSPPVLGTRVGFGAGAASLVRYKRTDPGQVAPWAIDPALPAGSVSSSQRPFTWWEDPRSAVTMLYTDPADGKIKDVGGQLVFPSATVAPVGPVTAIDTILDRRYLAFARFADGSIRQATFTGTWTDVPVTIGAANPPRTSPVATPRDAVSDSIWYACGPATGTLFCEHRIGPPSSAQNGLEFSTDFGAGTFIDGTRPSSLGERNSTFARRWIFAAVATSAGTKGIYTRRDFTFGATTFNFGALQTIDSSPTAAFSSPMPISVANNVSVFYFRTDTGATTKLMKAAWDSATSTWGAPQVVHEVGVQIPPGNDPAPYMAAFQGSLQVAFRLPFGAGVRDVVNLASTSTGFVKQLLPGASYAPGLAAISASKFFSVDTSTGTPTQLGPSVWPTTTAFTSDRMGLGYAVQGAALFEVNFNDGARRLLGTQQFSGATAMAYAAPSSLYVVQSNKLWQVDLATGSGTDKGLDMTGVTSIANLKGGGLYFLRNGSLFSLSSATTALGAPGFWAPGAAISETPERAMLINQPGYGLYVVDNLATSVTPVRASANLVTQPIAIDHADWVKDHTTVVTNVSTLAPDSTKTAEQLREDTSAGLHSVGQVITADPTRTYTWSIYARGSGRNFLELYLTTPEDFGSGAEVIVDLTFGTVVSSKTFGTGLLINASIEDAGSGWKRVTVTGRPRGVAGAAVRAVAHLMKTGGVASYAGDGSSGVFLWGGELKLTNDFATPNQVSDPDRPDLATWAKNRSSIIDDGTRAPDLKGNAFKWIEDTTAGTHYLDQTVAADPTRPSTWSIYLKAAGRTGGSLYLTTPSNSNSGASAQFDLVNKTAVGSASGTGTVLGAQLTDVGNGWFRVSVTGTANAAAGNRVRVVLYSPNGGAGDGASGFYVWRGELRGQLDSTLSSPIKAVVDAPVDCNPANSACTDVLYVLRASGQLGKLTGLGLTDGAPAAVLGTVLGYQQLGATTWATGTLLTPRNY
jgi:hypothetical protein